MKTPDKIRLHGIFPYDRSGKARWLLTELGVEFENRWFNRDNPEFETPEFLRLNPMGRIPVLEIGDRPMSESGAICSYLADRFADRGLAPAISSPERAEYEQWMYFAAATLDPIQSKIMIIEDIPAGEVRDNKESALQEELLGALKALDRVLSRSEYLVHDRFSAADICVSYHLFWLPLWPELNSVIQPFKSVVSYIERMRARPAALRSEVFSYQG